MGQGQLVEVADTKLFVEERGAAEGFPVLVLHGGPGLDHYMFGDYLDPLTADGRYRLVLIDERSQGRSDRSAPHTWTIERMAADITSLAGSLGLSSYAVLGHSFGAFLALQHAVDFPGAAKATIVSAGVASARWLARVEDEIAAFEPVELREQVASSWAREATAQTEDETRTIWIDQLPFHFWDPGDPRIDDYALRTAQARTHPTCSASSRRATTAVSRSKTGCLQCHNRCSCSQVATTAPAALMPVRTWPNGCPVRNSSCSRTQPTCSSSKSRSAA